MFYNPISFIEMSGVNRLNAIRKCGSANWRLSTNLGLRGRLVFVEGVNLELLAMLKMNKVDIRFK